MDIKNLIIRKHSDSEIVYDPLKIGDDAITLLVENVGDTDIKNAGLYLVPSTLPGDLENLPDKTPYTDYLDLIAWGTATDNGETVSGGLRLEGTPPVYFTREQGAKHSNRIPIETIPAYSSIELTLRLETPSSVSARRLYVNLVIE